MIPLNLTILISLVAPYAAAPRTTVAVFNDPLFPYFAAGTGLTPPDVAMHLKNIGLSAKLLNGPQLADPKTFNAERFCALVNLYGNTFPVDAAENIRRFHQNRGGLISVGVPYCHPCRQVGAAGWTYVAAKSDVIERATDDAHSGSACLRLRKDSTPGWSGAYSSRAPTLHGAKYVVSAWVRTEGEPGLEPSDTLYLRFFGEGGNFIGQWGPRLPKNACKWQMISQEVKAPAGAAEMDVCPAFWGSPGTVWLDDVRLETPDSKKNLVGNSGFEAPGGDWIDLGHESLWFSHERIGSGSFYTGTAKRGPLRYRDANDPLKLSLIEWKRWIRAWDERFVNSQALNPTSLPKGDKVTSVVEYEDQSHAWPIIAAIHHECDQFKGAIDVWAGGQLFAHIGLYDPVDQREVIARAAVYIAAESGRITLAERDEILARADTLYREQKPPTGLTPVTEPKPFKGIFPKSPRPARELVAANIRHEPLDQQLLLTSLQGLVNRKQPRIYFELTNFPGDPSPDERWLDWLQKRGDVESVRRVDDPLDLLREFRSAFNALVVTDPSVPATINVATMIAGLEGLLIASPKLAGDLDIPVAQDLRGRWKTNAEAMAWAADELWPRLNHHVLACSHPDLPHLRDYLVAHKVFTFWVTGPVDGQPPVGAPLAEQLVIERVLAKAPVNVGCLGAPYQGVGVGFSEGPGVSMLTRYGKFLSWSNTNANLSVHSGTEPRSPFRHKPAPCPPLDSDKVYITMMISDGDAPVNWYQFYPGVYWNDPQRGKFPLTWSTGPSVYDLIPDIMDYYYSRANENDCFVAACSGAGYCYPDLFASQYAKRDDVFGEYLKLTNMAMRRLDLHGVWTHTATGDRLKAFAEKVPMVSYLLPDYSRLPGTTAENANKLIAGRVPTFHALTSFNPSLGDEATVQLMLNDIRNYTPKERPAFMHVFVQCYPWTPTKLHDVLNRIGSEYVPVRADHLAELYRRAER